MKNFILSLAAISVAVQAAVLPPKSNKIDWAYEMKRQVAQMTSMAGKGGKVADPPGATSKKVVVSPRVKVPGAKAVKLRYGPYRVINMGQKSLAGESGMLWNFPDTDVPKPCDDCTLVGIVGGLEYPDGTNANIDTGMWLHHMVQFTIGQGRQDATCSAAIFSLPHFDVGTTAFASERMFASGNERTPIEFTKPTPNAAQPGYHLRSTDKFAFIVDLMNMNMEDKTVYLTITYDYVDGFPQGWDNIRPIWFDADQCKLSEVAPKTQNGAFSIDAEPWKPNFEGQLLNTISHLHDGGVSLDLKVNGQKVCTSNASYGERPEYVLSSNYMQMGSDKMAKNHISTMTNCGPNGGFTVPKLSKDQTWVITGNYDYTKFPGNIEGGTQASVMAIAVMYVQVPRGSYAA